MLFKHCSLMSWKQEDFFLIEILFYLSRQCCLFILLLLESVYFTCLFISKFLLLNKYGHYIIFPLLIQSPSPHRRVLTLSSLQPLPPQAWQHITGAASIAKSPDAECHMNKYETQHYTESTDALWPVSCPCSIN